MKPTSMPMINIFVFMYDDDDDEKNSKFGLTQHKKHRVMVKR